MTIGSVILIILGVMALIGIGYNAIRDFDVPAMGLVLAFAAVVGLNFLPTMNVGNFYFGIGTALFFIATFALWLFRGKMRNKVLSLIITIVLAGTVYGATRLSAYFGSELWANMNVYYALIIGLLSFIVTRNAKYGFIVSVLSVMTVTLLTQIGGTINLDYAYTDSIIAGTVAIVLYSLVAKLMPSRPSKMSYYFETSRMLDE